MYRVFTLFGKWGRMYMYISSIQSFRDFVSFEVPWLSRLCVSQNFNSQQRNYYLCQEGPGTDGSF